MKQSEGWPTADFKSSPREGTSMPAQQETPSKDAIRQQLRDLGYANVPDEVLDEFMVDLQQLYRSSNTHHQQYVIFSLFTVYILMFNYLLLVELNSYNLVIIYYLYNLFSII